MERSPNYSVLVLLTGFSSLFAPETFAQHGEQLFIQNCTACHTIGGGSLVGPDLHGVAEKYEEEWIIRFIQSSQTLIQAGDEKAVAAFRQYNRVPMPDFLFSEDEVRAIMTYITSKSTSTGTAEVGQPAATVKPIEPEATLQPDKKPAKYDRPYKRLMFWSFTLAIVTALVLLYFTTRS
ncbi:MAG: cytochrome c [Cyclobacteriaceae bacterium]